MFTHENPSTAQVQLIKQKYPVGTTIKCLKMNDPYAPVKSGTIGTVDLVDDMGQIHMKWSNGRTLALVPGHDNFIIDGVETVSVSFREITPDDLAGLYAADAFTDLKVRIDVYDADGNSSYLFLREKEFQLLGEEYISSHVQLDYMSSIEDWCVLLDVNPFYNDETRFPPKTITVQRWGHHDARFEEIYYCPDTKRYYIRQLASHENFARWISAYRKQGYFEDGAEIRANVTFVCDGESEKVTYNNWNGNAAYSDTFNPNFGKQNN